MPLTLRMIFITAIAALWILFYSYWFISAIGVKKSVRATPRWKSVGIRVALVIAIVVLNRTVRARHIIFVRSSSTAVNMVGIILCIAGLSFAVWARLNLGRNWGTPMSLKQGHELVTTGPYRFVRHPIYTGILLALVGTAAVVGLFWLLMVLVVGTFFVYSAKTEERLMMQTFPDAYPAYRRRTNAMIPFVW